ESRHESTRHHVIGLHEDQSRARAILEVSRKSKVISACCSSPHVDRGAFVPTSGFCEHSSISFWKPGNAALLDSPPAIPTEALMRRIGLAVVLALGLLIAPLAARAQQKAMPIIGYLDTASASTTVQFMEEFRRGLRDGGYVDGQNVAIKYRLAEGDYGKLRALAADLVRRQVAVIATINTPTILAAKAETKTIPIVFAVGVDPVKFGLVASLNRPGGNLTGLTQLNIEMEAKRVQVLHELAPADTSIAMLINPTSPAYSEAATESARSAARVLGVRLLVLNASTPSGIEAVFRTLVAKRVKLLLVSGDSFLVAQRNQLVELAARYAVPALYHRREFTV